MKTRLKKISIITVALVLLASTLALLGCNKKTDDTYLVEAETVFLLDGDSNAYGMPALLALDLRASKVILRPDGTITLRVILNDFAIQLINDMAGDTLQSISLQPIVDMYLKYILPGFDLSDMEGSLKILEKDLGVSFIGLDFSNPNIIAIAEALKTTGQLPANIKVPANFGVEYNTVYYLKDVVSEYSGTHKGVFVGEHNSDLGEPFIIMTIAENAETKVTQITGSIDFINLKLIANLKK